MIYIKVFRCNHLQENSILLWDESREGVLVDPGFYWDEEFAALDESLRKEGITLKAIWLTHAHFDHFYGVGPIVFSLPGQPLRGYICKDWTEVPQPPRGPQRLPVYLHSAEQMLLDLSPKMTRPFGLKAPDATFSYTPLAEGDVLSFGKASFRVIETPGHSPGGVCFYDEADRLLLTGDTLFAGAIGRSDMAGGDYDKLIVSIMERLLGLPGDVEILPGHGGRSDIATERTHNPFLQPFNEPEEETPFL